MNQLLITKFIFEIVVFVKNEITISFVRQKHRIQIKGCLKVLLNYFIHLMSSRHMSAFMPFQELYLPLGFNQYLYLNQCLRYPIGLSFFIGFVLH